MALKVYIDSLDGLDEAIQKLYVEDSSEGGYRLDIEDKLVPERRLTTLQNKLDKFEGWVSPEDHQALQTKYDTELANLDIDATVRTKVSEELGNWETEKQGYLDTINGFKAEKDRSLYKDAITAAATKAGVKASAIEDVILRGGNTFKVVEGKLKAYDADGNEKFYRGDKDYTPEHWLSDIKSSAAHLFDEAVGGGSVGNVKARPSTQNNNTGKDKAQNARDMIAQGLAQQND